MSPRSTAPAARSAELRLVGLHVRGGSYALARAELEALAGADRLDADGILDLAEVRWRTGDLAGAAAAAAAWLGEASAEPGAGTALANAICAEAAAERGEAEASATYVDAASAGVADGPALAALLAGITARAPWPWPAELEPPPVEAWGDRDPAAGEAAATGEPAAATSPGDAARPRDIPLAAAAADLVAAGTALLATSPERAAVLLALALRADRAAAETVLAALDAAGAPGPGGLSEAAAPAGPAALAFVRAEALRAAGRNDEARIAYASAERLALAPAEAGPSGSPQ